MVIDRGVVAVVVLVKAVTDPRTERYQLLQ